MAKKTLSERMAEAQKKRSGESNDTSLLGTQLTQNTETSAKANASADVVGKIQSEGISMPAARKPFQKLPVDKCRPWKKHDRSDFWLTEKRTQELAKSIKEQGQKQLGLVRLASDENGEDIYEIIYGVRRWYACRLAGVPFSAEIVKKGVSDSELFEMMDDENFTSKDISDLERFASYYRAIRDGDYSRERLIERKNCGKATISRWMKAGSLCEHPVIWAALVPVMGGVTLNAATELANSMPSTITDSMNEKVKALKNISEEDVTGETVDETERLLRSAADSRIVSILNILTGNSDKEAGKDKGTLSGEAPTITPPPAKVKSSHITQHRKTILGSTFNPANGSTRITIEKDLVLKTSGDPEKLLQHLKGVVEELSQTWASHGLSDD